MIIRTSEFEAAIQAKSWSEWPTPTMLPEDTGLPMVVCLPARDPSHYRPPRIKVSRDHGQRLNLDRLVNVSISDAPTVFGETGLPKHDLRQVRAWILLNQDVLLRYWNREMFTDDMMAALRPLGKPRDRK
jgi:hypothetical protein